MKLNYKNSTRRNNKRTAKGKPTKLPNLKNKEKPTFRESILIKFKGNE